MKSSILARIQGISHGFGTRAEPVPPPFAENWEVRKARWKQVHRTDSCEITGFGQECGEIDAQFSYVSGLPISAMHADCVPILMARKDGSAVAAVHAGWRGTRARILRSLWNQLEGRGESPRDWVAAVGPAIGPCCYEVSEELAQDFASEFGFPVKSRMLDLPELNATELRAIGVGEVDLLRACTRCAVNAGGQPIFHSYRREGIAARQYSVIQIL